MQKEPKDQRLPGMPGPPPEILARREAVQNALKDLHSAMRTVTDNLRGQDGAQITFNEHILGDKIRVTITPGKDTKH